MSLNDWFKVFEEGVDRANEVFGDIRGIYETATGGGTSDLPEDFPNEPSEQEPITGSDANTPQRSMPEWVIPVALVIGLLLLMPKGK